MERRTFFKNLIGGTAALAMAPKLFAEIVEHPYEIPPEQIFTQGEGLWIFREDKLMAYSALPGVAVEMRRDVIEVKGISDFPLEPYTHYSPGFLEVWYAVENLHVIDDSILKMDGENFQLIMKKDYTLESDVILTDFYISIHNAIDPVPEAQKLRSVKFNCIGETRMIFEKG